MGLLAAALLNGCATPPMGPTAHVMPAPGKPFEAFAQDQATCKQFAAGEVDGDAAMSNLKEFGTAAISTALGAGLGAAVRGGRGAEVGSSVGAIGGAAMAGSWFIARSGQSARTLRPCIYSMYVCPRQSDPRQSDPRQSDRRQSDRGQSDRGQSERKRGEGWFKGCRGRILPGPGSRRPVRC